MDIKIGEYEYYIGQLPAREQMHVGRRMYFLYASGEPLENLGKMDQEDLDYCTDVCLSVCSRRQEGNTLAPMFSKAANRIMFEDLSGKDLLNLVLAVVKQNKVMDFFF